ncbi:hypothetical protein [Rhizobium grahamii]|uniref:Uncharacterized protein n=2 Tax=Rhizobium grahamii TaxID=1120045 RepID=S3HA55_9HYPH|nr:hypothetical protein [Rhizobium grahamii]EPE95065.1 hypothetical protein RGCCGE502_27007 [Rhizobium grahamii CCGE 502]RDJ07907.1 hypothetical protein B5K06_21465 [Rhizobium grahamii]
MKHQTLEQLQAVAEVDQAFPQRIMSRDERLARWVALLEASPNRRLATLYQTEHQPTSILSRLRSDNSPISVAFDDPILRLSGLEDDTYGQAKTFFGLTDGELHNVLCYCHFGATVSAATAAHYVRGVLGTEKPSLFSRLRALFMY